jgi:hypothetical protein
MKLSQVVAVDKGLRQRITEEITGLHQATQKPQLMTGLRKEYVPKVEGEETYPVEEQKVQFLAEEVIARVQALFSELLNATARKDWSNCKARANVVVSGNVLIPDAPVHYLLFVGKQLIYLRTLVEKILTLDPGVDWHLDPSSGMWKTNPIITQRTRKVKKVLVKVQPTKEHPAQAESYDSDEVAGTWHTVKASGAIPLIRKKEILTKIDAVADAVKIALEEANSIEAEPVHVGAALLGYIFKP